MNRLIEQSELERAQRQLRQLSAELKTTAPTIATRAGALARECELRIDKLKREGAR